MPGGGLCQLSSKSATFPPLPRKTSADNADTTTTNRAARCELLPVCGWSGTCRPLLSNPHANRGIIGTPQRVRLVMSDAELIAQVEVNDSPTTPYHPVCPFFSRDIRAHRGTFNPVTHLL
jgi:hypothetical protein